MSYELASWGRAVMAALAEDSGAKVIALFQPQIKVNGKDKLGGAETVPNDLQSLKPMLQGMCSPERTDEAFKALM
jgi:hypothetical protein